MAEIIVAVIVGFIFGIGAASIAKDKPVGSLRVDHSDPDSGPYLFLELDRGIGNIYKKHYVRMRVKIENYIPHE